MSKIFGICAFKLGEAPLRNFNKICEIMTTPTIYRSVESVLGTLTNYKVDTVAATSLLQVYENALKSCNESTRENPNNKKHPFIVLEGLDGSGKSTVSKVLASKINAVKWGTPPESVTKIRPLFDDHKQLRTAYYGLGNYIAALECAVILNKQPVVMDRYWHSTAAYAIAQAVHDFPGQIEIPPTGDSFYHWPSDLLKPDAVLFLNVDEEKRLERISRRKNFTTQEVLMKNSKHLRDNIVLAYKNMVDPEVIFVDSNGTVNSCVNEIVTKIQHLL